MMTGHWETWHIGVLTHYIPPMVLQPWLSSVSSHGNHSVHYPMASMGWRCLHPPPNSYNPVDIQLHYTLPEVFSHPLWTLWWTSIGEVITSHWSTQGKPCWPGTGWLPDHYLLRHCLTVTPLGSWLNWGGAGTSVPCLADTHTQGNASLWCDEKKSVSVEVSVHDCLHWSITS